MTTVRAPRAAPRAASYPTAPVAQMISLLPALLNLSLYAGDSVSLSFAFSDLNGVPVNMSGTWSAQVRSAPGAADPPLEVFTVDVTQAASGIITASLSAAQTAAMPIATALAWDIQQVSGIGTRTTHRGSLTLTEDVTRP